MCDEVCKLDIWWISGWYNLNQDGADDNDDNDDDDNDDADDDDDDDDNGGFD